MTDYAEYMQSDEWKRKRTRIRRRARGWCERCGVNRRYAIHHLTYERLGHEELGDLLAVCQGCHDFLHAKSDYDPAQAVSSFTKEEIGVIRLYKEMGMEVEEAVALRYVGPWEEVVLDRYLRAAFGHGINYIRVYLWRKQLGVSGDRCRE